MAALLQTAVRGQAPRTVAEGASAVAVAGTTLVLDAGRRRPLGVAARRRPDAPDVLLAPERLFPQDPAAAAAG